MKQTVIRWFLPGVLSLAAVALVPSAVAAHGASSCLAPSGTDDTAALQSALDRCSGARHRCVVALCEGMFKIAPVRVGDFRGTLRGAGRERTTLQALPDLLVNDNPEGYWTDDPLDSYLHPWPYLLQFIGGQVAIRDLAITVPTPGPDQAPTQGWTELPGFESEELAGAILVTGRETARSEVSRVRVTAGTYEAGFGTTPTLLAGVALRGLVYDPDAVDPGDPFGFPVHALAGRHTVSDSLLVGMISGVSLGELGNARVTIWRNEMRSLIGVDALDASHSRVRVVANRWDVEAVGFQAFLNIDGAPSERNTILVDHNRGTVGPFFGEGSAIYVQDPVILPEPGDSTVIVSGNDLQVGSPDEGAFSGIEVYGAGRLFVSRNTLRGRVDAFAGIGGVGIGIDQTTGCRVIRNDLGGLATAVADLHLGSETSDCLALVGRHDTVLDEGASNRLFRFSRHRW